MLRGLSLLAIWGGVVILMRSLQRAQRKLLATDRLAAIGRSAGSISHDLRHPLTVVVANAEFLCEPDLEPAQREKLYQEIRLAADQVTNLVNSLLECSDAGDALRVAFGPLEETVQRALRAVRAHPECRGIEISVF